MWQSFFSFLGGLFSKSNLRLEDREDFGSVTREWKELVQELKAEVADLRREVTELRDRLCAEEQRTEQCEEGRREDAALIADLKRRIEQLEQNT